MCGISFILDPTRRADIASRLARLHAPIRHRGPDAERFAIIDASGAIDVCESAEQLDHSRTDSVAGLAFRRLKILDLTDAAAQPMPSRDRSAWILFNGEIYNFRELRRELSSARTVPWETDGDTEVILAAYEAWGHDCFARLEGMWAIVIVDLRRRVVVASRDRFGIKPLYWSLASGSLVLTSEIRQHLAVMDGRPRANATRVAMHLRGTRFPMNGETFIDEVLEVPPATWFEIPFDGPIEPPKFREYWRLADFTADPSIRYERALEQFDDVFKCAIDSHRVADVKVGSLLSGGLDSSMVSSVLAEQMRRGGRELPLFTFGFRGEYEAYSELPYAEAVAARERMPLHETTFDADWVKSNVARVVSTIEEPPLAMPVLAQYRLFELCREHGCTVILDGQGADEILAGYPYHQRMIVSRSIRSGRIFAAMREIREIAARARMNVARVAFDWYAAPAFRRTKKPRWINADYGRPSRRAALDVSRDPSPLNQRLFFDVRHGNVKVILGYADRNAMAHSIEARVPFFDRRLVELAFSLPAEYKIANGDRKRILRDLARRRLPREVTERGDRMGFGTPDVAMIDGPLHGVIEERLHNFRSVAVGALPPRDDQRARWRLFTLALWADAFGVAF